jgi:hypothetical protein
VKRAAQADEENKGPKGYEVGYELFSMNGKTLGAGEPIRVKQGERVLFSMCSMRALRRSVSRFRATSFTWWCSAAIPCRRLPRWRCCGWAPRSASPPAMDHPGAFVLGDLSDDDRSHGMGIVVEYSGHEGKPRWVKPKPFPLGLYALWQE